MRFVFALSALLLIPLARAVPTADYLPADTDPDPSIPTPESVLGWEVGDWRVSHDQLLGYMRALAESSDRVTLEVNGWTHERRPIVQLIITSPENHGQLDTLRQRHLDSVENNDDGAPLVVWLGHSIHGNEESGANAGLLSAFYLAASRSDFVTDLLDGSIIVFDPAFNPDGLNRFASWSNSNRSKNPVPDTNHRIHNESWPSSRTNHYWFDLNRDWLPLVHPESRARVEQFHRWLPHVLTDQHERSGDGYFFQPGVPSRQNPLTPVENIEMTRALADFHAAAMDRDGEIFFTEDAYDDFYFGKGSTYPDINGSIGILFEQPKLSGPVMDRGTGRVTFINAIENHLRTTLSTLRGAWTLRDRLKRYQRGFFATMSERAREADFAAWVIGDDGDPARAAALLEVLDHHRIEYRPLGKDLEAGGYRFVAGRAWVIPVRQRQFGMAQAMMATISEFEDETFYDVSAWTQPLAYNLPFARVSRVPPTGDPAAVQRVAPRGDAIAWIVPWNQHRAAAWLQRLLDAGVLVRAATKPFTVTTANGTRDLERGSLVIHAGLQNDDGAEQALKILGDAARSGVDVVNASSSLTPAGPDLGATHFGLIKPIRPLMVIGGGVSPYDAGEAWHHFDLRLGKVPVMVEGWRLNAVRLSDYSHLIMVDGDYSGINGGLKARIAQWVLQGGTLIAAARAVGWAESLCFDHDPSACPSESANTVTSEPPASRRYADFGSDQAQGVIGGAIVDARLDLTHPLAFGYLRPELPLFRRGTVTLTPSGNAYTTALRYAEDPKLAGFISSKRLDEIRAKPALIAERQGRGLVVRFANNPLFRGFWHGTERLFDNALYMGQLVQDTHLPE
ncbi:MAG: M14 family zinc carboxypeptidase [Xanthomonadales bacterium]|nr:M14 family zinc carboxypeptidase [Xanthomonadales bacterium]